MKKPRQYRWLIWQIITFAVVVIFLSWDSSPVPGPDGRVVVDLYEFSLQQNMESYRTVTIFGPPFDNELAGVMPKEEANRLPQKDGDQLERKVLIAKVPVVKVIKRERNETLIWLSNYIPFMNQIPTRFLYRAGGGWFMEVSLSMQQWKLLRALREKGLGPLDFIPNE